MAATINSVTGDFASSTFQAGASISAKGGYGVKLHSTALQVVLATAGSLNVGIIDGDGAYSSGDAIPIICTPGMLAPAIAGGTIAVGDKVKTDSNGKWVATTNPGEAYYGLAESAASSNGYFSLRIQPGTVLPIGAQATTGTAGTAGQVAVTGLTATSVVLVTIAEDPGTNLALSDVVAGTDLFTVYTRNTNTDARAALSGKKVNYLVVSY